MKRKSNPMTVADIMSEHPRTVSTPSRSCNRWKSDTVPVVNKEGDLVGILSDLDLRSLTVDLIGSKEPIGTIIPHGGGPVGSIMSGGVISVTPDAELEELIDLLLENRIGAIPVVDGEGAVVGIVSYVDILHQWPRQGHHLVRLTIALYRTA